MTTTNRIAPSKLRAQRKALNPPIPVDTVDLLRTTAKAVYDQVQDDLDTRLTSLLGGAKSLTEIEQQFAVRLHDREDDFRNQMRTAITDSVMVAVSHALAKLREELMDQIAPLADLRQQLLEKMEQIDRNDTERFEQLAESLRDELMTVARERFTPPIINVELPQALPAEVIVNVPEQKPTKRTIQYDDYSRPIWDRAEKEIHF